MPTLPKSKIERPQIQRPRIRLPAKRIDVATRLGLDLDPRPRMAWEGKLLGHSGSAKDGEVFLQAEMRFHDDIVEGEGRAPNFPKPAPGAAFMVEGAVEGGIADLAIWFDADKLHATPFLCRGRVDASQRNIRGEWSCGCFQPETCSCEGATGVFHLWRVS